MGYRRSDERIREDISDRLMENDELDPSNVSVNVEDGTVTLTGTVDDRRQKYLAEELAESVMGVQDVQNQLRVQRGERTERPTSGSERSTTTDGGARSGSR
jgi:osmotically-inducible protein OsmY